MRPMFPVPLRNALSAAVLTTLAALAPAQENAWISHGPTDVGWVNDLAIADAVVYAATLNGVFRSDDGGTTWKQAGLTGVSRSSRSRRAPALPRCSHGRSACTHHRISTFRGTRARPGPASPARTRRSSSASTRSILGSAQEGGRHETRSPSRGHSGDRVGLPQAPRSATPVDDASVHRAPARHSQCPRSDDYRVSDPDSGQPARRDHRRSRRKPVVRRIRRRCQEHRPDHSGRRHYGVSAGPQSCERTFQYRGGTRRQPLVHPCPSRRRPRECRDRPDHSGRRHHGVSASRWERTWRYRRGPRREPVVRLDGQQRDRPYYDHRQSSRSSRSQRRRAGPAPSPRDPTETSGSPRRAPTRSAASRPLASSPSSRFRRRTATPERSSPAPTEASGSRSSPPTRSAASRLLASSPSSRFRLRTAHPTGQRSPPGPTETCGSRRTPQTRSAA